MRGKREKETILIVEEDPTTTTTKKKEDRGNSIPASKFISIASKKTEMFPREIS